MARSSNTPARPDAARRPADADRAASLHGSEVQRGTGKAEGTSFERAEREGTCTVHAHASNSADGRDSEAERQASESADRSDESRCAENAFRKIVCKQKTKADRLLIAAVLNSVMQRHSISAGRLSVIVDMNVKRIQKMLAADESIPSHMAKRMPTEMRRDYLAGYAVAIGCDSTTSPAPALEHIRRTRNIAAAQDLEDKARDLSREMQRPR